ncbi:MAG: hypothetical protein WDW38_009894 [Sanguina aurantia]
MAPGSHPRQAWLQRRRGGAAGLVPLLVVASQQAASASRGLLPMGLGSTLRLVAAGVTGVGVAAEVTEHPVSVRLLRSPVLCTAACAGWRRSGAVVSGDKTWSKCGCAMICRRVGQRQLTAALRLLLLLALLLLALQRPRTSVRP